MTRVAIIGAGITGLACARRLAQAGLRPVLFDKGRGIGGRVATRRAAGLHFDHGAQYVTARGDGFAAVLRDLADAGAVAPWQGGSGKTRIVGCPGMSSLARGLAAGLTAGLTAGLATGMTAGLALDIRQGAQVSAVAPDPSGWVLRLGTEVQRASHLVITVPAPQVAGLLGAGHPLVTQIAGVKMVPCLTLMAAVAGPAPFVTRRDPDDPLAWIAQDSSKPGRPQGDAVAWVAQAGEGFSLAHLEDDPATIAARMLPLLCDRLGVAAGQVRHAAAHRWRHARASEPLGRPFLRDDAGTLYLGGDWCLGPRVEAAWTSGTALAEDLLDQTRNPVIRASPRTLRSRPDQDA